METASSCFFFRPFLMHAVTAWAQALLPEAVPALLGGTTAAGLYTQGAESVVQLSSYGPEALV